MKGRSLSVLVIDDEPTIAKMVDLCLKRTGWTVHTTLDPTQGAALARCIKPDVILCDAQMPHVSGAQIISQLRADAETAQIPIVLMSGGDAEAFSHVPLAGFLQKPFGPKEVRAALASAAAAAP
ncbi:MAG TPA: response regulator [Methylomirabilota bacterium]|nr:response regulator [Methylomirabilota bacterium]